MKKQKRHRDSKLFPMLFLGFVRRPNLALAWAGKWGRVNVHPIGQLTRLAVRQQLNSYEDIISNTSLFVILGSPTSYPRPDKC
jgi:hypothetical protein